MSTLNFIPTLRQKVSLSFAYLAYSGENLVGDPAVPAQILATINQSMPGIPPLLDANQQVDWRVVWGPACYTFPHAKYQDNMLFVAQQISEPANYIIAVRGTNSRAIWDFVEEDLEVWRKVPWTLPQGMTVPGSPMISRATQDGLHVLLNDLTPIEGMPGSPDNITAFLSGLAAKVKFNLLFTGHSLGGALAPTLALWFKQSQGIVGGWDPQHRASISTVSFAGPTAGNQDFANFFNAQLGWACDRIYNTIDIVPLAWEEASLDQLQNIYNPAIHIPLSQKLLINFIKLTVKGYVQVGVGNPIIWTIQSTGKPSYLDQAGIQHTHSYPNLLQVPELLKE